jgi:hypothetical protein
MLSFLTNTLNDSTKGCFFGINGSSYRVTRGFMLKNFVFYTTRRFYSGSHIFNDSFLLCKSFNVKSFLGQRNFIFVSLLSHCCCRVTDLAEFNAANWHDLLESGRTYLNVVNEHTALSRICLKVDDKFITEFSKLD